MVYEHGEIAVREGAEDEFAEMFWQHVPAVFEQAEGFVSIELHRCVERPSVFLLRVGWETVEAHTVGFRGSPLFTQWRELATPYFAEPPRVEHYRPTG
jgi:heme-degrading monooxygenase HmoA